MPRNDQVTRQWHLLRHLEAAAHGATLQALANAGGADGPPPPHHACPTVTRTTRTSSFHASAFAWP
jgi:hypothetical protein